MNFDSSSARKTAYPRRECSADQVPEAQFNSNAVVKTLRSAEVEDGVAGRHNRRVAAVQAVMVD